MCQIHGIYVRVQRRAWKNICPDFIHKLWIESHHSHGLQVNLHCKYYCPMQIGFTMNNFKSQIILQATKTGPVPGAAYLFSCSIFIIAILTTMVLKKLLNGRRLSEIVAINEDNQISKIHENLGKISHI